jgi:hypothetical protein
MRTAEAGVAELRETRALCYRRSQDICISLPTLAWHQLAAAGASAFSRTGIPFECLCPLQASFLGFGSAM